MLHILTATLLQIRKQKKIHPFIFIPKTSNIKSHKHLETNLYAYKGNQSIYRTGVRLFGSSLFCCSSFSS